MMKAPSEPRVLVFNAGSSSFKCACIEPGSGRVLDAVLAERLGQPDARVSHTRGNERREKPHSLANSEHVGGVVERSQVAILLDGREHVAAEAAKRLGRPLESLELVTAHLGNGCSACAIRGGESVDTTMGLTPLEGLAMGTRSGDVDPSLFQFLAERKGYRVEQTNALLEHESGLLGISGVSNDMRRLLELEAEGHERARLAVLVFCHRLAKAVLGLCAGLRRLDALVFTGGIGEHAVRVRQLTIERLALLRPEVDPELNAKHGAGRGGRITSRASGVLGLVVPTNEELIIGREMLRCISAS